MGVWLQAIEAGGRVWSRLGSSAVQTGLSLVGACAVAWCLLLIWSKRRPGRGAEDGGLRVVSRLDLDPRRRVLVIASGERRLLIGLGESGPPRLLTELYPSAQLAGLGVAEDEAAGEDLPAVAADKEHQFEGH